jgi:hypothetical protein
MAVPKLKIVAREREQQFSAVSADSHWFFEPWIQVFKGLSQLASVLVGILIGAILFFLFMYAYNRIPPIENGQKNPQPANTGAQEFVALKNVFIHNKPDVSADTRIGVCEQGARLRVIGTQSIGKRVWYEIEILSKHSMKLDSTGKKWVAGESVTMSRPYAANAR